ncbi:hypothetical protein V4F39_03805 [Aquincola sp. MAHUQ-54]|uniref:MxaA protein n=1 Tax=Aquincola agrisoli TaxID=3119538 RepID=A0AAW9QCB1_9BURK
MTTRPALLLAAMALATGPAAAQTVQADEPRAYGYLVGDTVARTVTLDLPAGVRLDAASLPRPGRRGSALELRSVAFRQGRELWLEYQVLLSPRAPRVLEMPGFELRFEDARGAATTLRVEAWPVAVSPLVAAEAPARRGFGELQPDVPPPPIDVSAPRLRLLLYGAAGLVLAAYLFHVYVGFPWWARRRRPFGAAWQWLQSMPSQPDGAQHRLAWARVHGALNSTAGSTLFEAGVEGFVAAHPRYAALRAELHAFFERSRRAFFAGSPADDDLAWLRAFCRRCRDAERGAA